MRADCIASAAEDLAKDKLIANRYLPNGLPLTAGSRLVVGGADNQARIYGLNGKLLLQSLKLSLCCFGRAALYALPSSRLWSEQRKLLAHGPS